MRRRAVLISLTTAAIVVLALVWILVLDNSGTKPRASNGCGTAPTTLPGKTEVQSMMVDGIEREYRLHLPTDYDQNTPTSLVLVFHWYTGDAKTMEFASMQSTYSNRQNYIVVYPQSTSFESTEGTITSWNDLACSAGSGPEGPTCTENFSADDWPFPPECGEPRDCVYCTCNDDLAFVGQLLDELEDTLCIDLDRVYATGVSNGAGFVHRLGCDMADRFAAIAPVGETLAKGFNCAPGTSTPISIMHLYGDRDRLIPADGSESTGGFSVVPVDDMIDAWASAESQGCDDSETPYPTSMDGNTGLACEQRANCATGAEVVSCSWEGDHHSSTQIGGVFGTKVIWEFFSKNSKQS
jgi:polyhydroxybutyrate depolymerase